MGFTTKCFVRKVSNELCDSLTKLGYEDLWTGYVHSEEARKLIADSFKSYDIRDRIDAAIREFHGWGEKPLKTEIAREVANRILEKVEIKIQ